MPTNQVTVFNPGANVPAFAKKNELSALSKALAGGASSGKRISIKGGVFRLYSDGKEITSIEDRHLDVVIVNAAPKISRTFYMATYDENNVSAPDCWSADGDKPDVTAKNIQSPTCATCKQNIKGSGQGDSRACRFSQRVAVVLGNDMEGDVLQLSLPAMSIFGKAEGENRPLQAYARWLAEQSIDPAALVTRLKFDTAAATPKLFFKATRWLTEDEYATCQKQGRSDDAMKAVTMSVAQMDGVKHGVDETPLKLEGKAPKAQVEEVAEEAEETAPPTVKKTAAKPTPQKTSTSKISSTIAEWDDTDD